jgi:hypothetical protein
MADDRPACHTGFAAPQRGRNSGRDLPTRRGGRRAAGAPPGANEAPRAPTAVPRRSHRPSPRHGGRAGERRGRPEGGDRRGRPCRRPDDEVGDGVCMSFGGSRGAAREPAGWPAPTEEPKPPEAEGARPASACRAGGSPRQPRVRRPSPGADPGLPEPAGQDLAPVRPPRGRRLPRRQCPRAGACCCSRGTRTTNGVSGPRPRHRPRDGRDHGHGPVAISRFWGTIPGAPAPSGLWRARTLEAPVNILLIGSGRARARARRALAPQPLCDGSSCAPGNPGTAQCGENVTWTSQDHGAVRPSAGGRTSGSWWSARGPLVRGLVDDLTAAGIRAFGPAGRRRGSRLQGLHESCAREAGIPTAAFARSPPWSRRAYVAERGAPIVVKADGLAAGKGVVVATTLDEALAAHRDDVRGRPGAAGAEVVSGGVPRRARRRASSPVRRRRAIPLRHRPGPQAVGDGRRGPEHRRHGRLLAAPVLTPEIQARVMREIVEPTLAPWRTGARPIGAPLRRAHAHRGRPKLIEYNARFGDPSARC